MDFAGWSKCDSSFVPPGAPNFRLAHHSKVSVFCVIPGCALLQGRRIPGPGSWGAQQSSVCCRSFFQKCNSHALFMCKTSRILHDGNYFLYIKKWLFAMSAADLITCHTYSKNWLQPLECQSRLLQREGSRRCNRSSWLLMHMTPFLPA